MQRSSLSAPPLSVGGEELACFLEACENDNEFNLSLCLLLDECHNAPTLVEVTPTHSGIISGINRSELLRPVIKVDYSLCDAE